MAIKQARGMDLAGDRQRLARVLRFLLRQQLTPTTCYACTTTIPVLGGFPESMVAPRLRIDYAQHAWAALGHGGRMLQLGGR